MPTCLFCNSERTKPAFYPSTLFNGKRFDYLQCLNCDLVFVNPIPDEVDLTLIYGPDYYAAHGGVPFRVAQLQLRAIKKYISTTEPVVLDFGCGKGDFVKASLEAGFTSRGVEFHPEQVKRLNNEIPSAGFVTYDEFKSSATQYDVIRLSNVFEHLTNPQAEFAALVSKLKHNGLIVINGPIETNFTVSLSVRKFFFELRNRFDKSFVASHKPTHIIMSNLKNQLAFFSRAGLVTQEVFVKESAWPLPVKWQYAKGAKGKLLWLFGKLSVFLSRLIPNWGNTIFYIGRRNAN